MHTQMTMKLRNVVSAVLNPPFFLRQRRLGRNREPIGKDEFVRRICNAAGDESAAALIWDFLADFILAPGFSPYPDDDLGLVFGLGEEDLDEDLICGTLTQLGLPLPTQAIIDEFGAVDTPLRVAHLAVRMAQESQVS